MPSTFWSIMQSMTRFMPSRSRAPSSVKGVGATGQMPVNGRVMLHGHPLTPEEIITASVTRRWKTR